MAHSSGELLLMNKGLGFESEEEDFKQFVQRYVLNAALGAGARRLNVNGAVTEAVAAWLAIERVVLDHKGGH